MKLPLFPLKLVAFPGEELNLHIFEPRYRQLIADVEKENITFGILVYSDHLMEYGTEVSLKEIHHRYEDGRLDIKTVGGKVFKMIDFENPMDGKLYAGGEIEFLENDYTVTNVQHLEFLFYLKEVLYLLKFPTDPDPETTTSFTYAHKVGLKLEEELALLKMTTESERQAFLISHFKRIIPAIKAIEKAKEKIKQNGHFKHLDPLSF